MGLITFFKKYFSLNNNPTKVENTIPDMKKFLIVGLGNVGEKYVETRHNVGFVVLDALAKKFEVGFEPNRFGSVASLKNKGRTFILLKPDTFMNLSGKAVKFWLTQEKIPIENLLVIGDDIALPFGVIRLKGKGGAAGHNGFQNIQDVLGSSQYARLRFGVGDDFPRGGQVDYVLGNWNDTEWEQLPERTQKAAEACLSFGMQGLGLTMTQFNGK